MSSSDGGSRLSSGIAWIEKSEQLGSLGKTIAQAFGGLIAFIFGGAIAIGDSGIGLIVGLIDAFGVGGEAWIRAFVESPADFLASGFQQGAAALGNEGWQALGPFLPWITVTVALGVVWAVTTYLDRQDSDVPGLGLDLPFIGNEAEEEGVDLPVVGNDDEGEGE
jgi:hypothetical protein